MKIVINKCYGGFSLSQEAYQRLNELGIPIVDTDSPDIEKEVIYTNKSGNKYPELWDMWLISDRSNPLLVKVVEELGDKANGKFAKLKVVEIPDGINFYIDDYDGNESVHEVHQVWE